MEDRVVSVTLDDIHKRFDANEVLKGISLSAHHGEVISVLGPSGSGKSTLLRCINRLINPTEGKIHIFGEEITASSGGELRRLRRQVAMIFQQFNLIFTYISKSRGKMKTDSLAVFMPVFYR